MMSSLFVLSSVFLSILIQSTHALVGCDAAGCPVDSSKNPLCTVGDRQLTAIGIDNFTVPLTNQETLTWTVGERSYVSESDARMEQDFYLGTPPSLQLHTQSAFGGCALFFKDAANDLSFLTSSIPPPLSTRSNQARSISGLRGNGTCGDALGTPCIDALLSQAKTLMGLSNVTGPYDDKFCQRFASSLQSSVPKNCSTAVPSNSWGEIIGKSIFGSNSSQPITEEDCHPTTGKDYELSLVASIPRYLASTSTFHSGFRGVMPILTLVFPPTGSNKAKPAPVLSCLAPVGVTGNTYNTYNSLPANGASGLRMPSPWIATSVVVGMFAVLQLI